MKFFALIVLAVSLGACKKIGGPKEKLTDRSTPRPTSADAALALLSPSDRASFESWKTSLVKSCSTSEVFGRGQPPTPPTRGLDLAVFYQKSGSSLVIMNRLGEYISLGQPTHLSGVERSSLKDSESQNGRVLRGIDAEAFRSGSNCELRVFGQTVYQAPLLAKLQVNAHFSFSGEEQGPRLFIPRGDIRQGGGSEFWVRSEAFVLPLIEEISPTEASFQDLENLLALNREEVRNYFILDNSGILKALQSEMQISARFSDPCLANVLPFNLEKPELQSVDGALATLALHGDRHEKEIVFQFRPEIVDILGLKNTGDTLKRWAIHTHYLFEGSLSQGGFSAIRSVRLATQAPVFDDLASVSCLVNRFKILHALFHNGSTQSYQPSLHSSFSPCRALAKEPDSLIYSHPDATQLLLSIFSDFSHNSSRNPLYFGDWRRALAKHSLELSRGGKNFANTLDPGGLHPFLQAAQLYKRALLEPLQVAPQLVSIYEAPILDLALDWAIRNDPPPTAGELQSISQVIERFGLHYMKSMAAFLESLREGAVTQRLLVAHALNTSSDSLASLERIASRAHGWGLQSWLESWQNTFLQSPPDPNTLKAWDLTLTGADNFLAADEARPHVLGVEIFLRDRQKLLVHALKDSRPWTRHTFDQLEKVLVFGKALGRCQGLKDGDHSALVHCVGLNSLSTQDGKILDPRNRRYADIAPQFAAFLKRLGESRSPAAQTHLENIFFKPLWRNCNDADFQQKTSLLGLKIDELRARGHDPALEREIIQIQDSDCP